MGLRCHGSSSYSLAVGLLVTANPQYLRPAAVSFLIAPWTGWLLFTFWCSVLLILPLKVLFPKGIHLPRVFWAMQRRFTLRGLFGSVGEGTARKKGCFQTGLPWKGVVWHVPVCWPQLPNDGNWDQLWPNYESPKPPLCPSFSSSLTTQRGRENGWDSDQVCPATTMWPRSQASDVLGEE